MPWNGPLSALAIQYLQTIQAKAASLPNGPYKTYILQHVNACRMDQPHDYGPPPASPQCTSVPAATGKTHSNQDAAALEEWLRLAAAQAAALPEPDWCALVHELDHAGGGGDNANKQGFRHRHKE